jgi:hypothetical protein
MGMARSVPGPGCSACREDQKNQVLKERQKSPRVEVAHAVASLAAKQGRDRKFAIETLQSSVHDCDGAIICED